MRRDYNFEFNHLASLYFLDKRKAGYFNRSDLIEFAGVFVKFRQQNEYDYLRVFQGYASTLFWKELKTAQGQCAVAEWMLRLFKESRGIRILGHANEVFYSSKAVAEIYQVLKVQDNNGLTFDEFMRLFQKVAEDNVCGSAGRTHV